KVRMVKKKATGVLSVQPVSIKSSNMSTVVEIQDIRGRLTKVSDKTAEREETFYNEYSQQGERRPDVYAASVFMALCPFEAYQSWAKQVNWNGTNGKAKLPKNLKDMVHQCVIQRFPDLTADDWFRIRNKVNERLRSTRKLDPELQLAGYSNN
ncbi:zinc finger MYM-type protein 4, partial [Clarias magur]